MAMTPIATPTFPDVPRASGVPSVFRSPVIQTITTIRLLQADVRTIGGMFFGPEWGIFTTGGQPFAIPNSFVSVDYRKEFRISDYPVESGGFQSFNKVATPFDVRVRFAISGPSSSTFGDIGNLLTGSQGTTRSDFLTQVDLACKSLDLFSVVTPDATYPSVNIVHYDYRRERQNGVGIILVDVWCQEVRVTATTQFSDTKSPEGALNQSGGTVQGQPPTPDQQASVPLTPAQANLQNTQASIVARHPEIPPELQ
jgi:hypothetical protein